MAACRREIRDSPHTISPFEAVGKSHFARALAKNCFCEFYHQFRQLLMVCLKRCYDALMPGGRLAVLIGDVRRRGRYPRTDGHYRGHAVSRGAGWNCWTPLHDDGYVVADPHSNEAGQNSPNTTTRRARARAPATVVAVNYPFSRSYSAQPAQCLNSALKAAPATARVVDTRPAAGRKGNVRQR